MNKNISFSIVIPTYNRASFIVNTINSILTQTYQNFEIIIVDDGSIDNTEEVVKTIINEKIKYYKINNSERGAARNYGTLKSTGDYVTFLDSDDELLPHYFSNACESITKYNNPPFLHLGYEIINPDSSLLFHVNDLKNDEIDFLVKGNLLSCMGCFMRTDISRKFLFNEDRELAGSEDWELWFRVLSNLGIKTDNRISARMHNHSNRSVYAGAQEKKLVRRMELVLKYAFTDEKVKENFEAHKKRIIAYSTSYIALHLALNGENKRSFFYALRFIKNYPLGVFTKRFLAVGKHIFLNSIRPSNKFDKVSAQVSTKADTFLNTSPTNATNNHVDSNSLLVSIIIPCYNAEKFIANTIHSVLNQSHQDLELLIINDGSTDNTEDAIAAIQDSRIFFSSKKNTGVSDTRNKGLEIAKGDYVLFLDADDLLSPNFLEKHVSYLEANRNFGFSSSKVMMINEEGKLISSKALNGTSNNILEDVLSYNTEIITSPSNYLFRKSVLENHNIKFDPELTSSADRFFLIELSKYAYGTLIENDCNLFYRVHEKSMSNIVNENLIHTSVLFQKKVLLIKSIPNELKYKFLFRTNYIFAGYYFKLRKLLPCFIYSIKSFYSSPLLFTKEVFKSKKTT